MKRVDRCTQPNLAQPVVDDAAAVLYGNGKAKVGGDRSGARFPGDNRLQILVPPWEGAVHLYF